MTEIFLSMGWLKLEIVRHESFLELQKQSAKVVLYRRLCHI